MFTVEAFENSLYEESTGGGGDPWDWSSAAVTRKPFAVAGDSTASFNDVYQWMISTDQTTLQQTPHEEDDAGGGTPPRNLLAVKKHPFKVKQRKTNHPQPPASRLLGLKRSPTSAAWSSPPTTGCSCGAIGGCVCGGAAAGGAATTDYYADTALCCENGGMCTGLCCGPPSLLQLKGGSPTGGRHVPHHVASSSSSNSSASSNMCSSLNRFTLQDENGKRKIRNDIMSIAESLPSLPGLYFDKKQKGFRVRYQNVYVGWVALSRFPSIEEAYCSARDIWENAKAHAEKFQTPQAAIIASLPLQKQARASGKNRGGRPRTVTQLPPEWGPATPRGGRTRNAPSNRRLNSWGPTSANTNSVPPMDGGGELTAAPSPTDHWSQQVATMPPSSAHSADLLYGTKFNEVSIFSAASMLEATAGGGGGGGYYLPSPISYGKPVVNDDLNFDTTPWSLHTLN